MLNEFKSANFSDLQILIVNENEQQSKYLITKLKFKANPIPVYQDNVEVERNKTIWSLLEGGKDDFYIYDRCGRLTYYVPYPISFLYRPYAKAAILSTYIDEPCGPCPPEELPKFSNNNTILLSSNFSLINKQDMENSTGFNFSVATNVSKTTNNSEERPHRNISTKVKPVKPEINPVLEELKVVLNKSKQLLNSVKSHHNPRNIAANGHHLGVKAKIGNNQTDNYKNATSHVLQYGNDTQLKHSHINRSDNVTDLGQQEPNISYKEKLQNINQTEWNTNITDDYNNFTSTASKSPSSSSFYRRFYPNYEKILDMALLSWLNKPIPVKLQVKSVPVTVTTPKPVTLTTKSIRNTTLPIASKQAHLAILVQNLKHRHQSPSSKHAP